jgi:uncharacterized protein YidB (DUF937 family)
VRSGVRRLQGAIGAVAVHCLRQRLRQGREQLIHRRSGYESQVNSWLGRGPNEPITAEDLRKVLDNDPG